MSRLSQAREAALAAGARHVDVYSRRSRTRLVVLGVEPEGTVGDRVEDGLAVRAWIADRGEEACGFHAASSGVSVTDAARRAVASARVTAGESVTPVTRRPPEREATIGELLDGAAARERDEENGEAPIAPDAGGLSLYDPDLARCSDAEARRRLQEMLEPVFRRHAPAQVRAGISLAEVESRMLCADGTELGERGTLAALRVRFPTAFGVARIDLAARRWQELAGIDLQALVSAYPPVGAPLEIRSGPGSSRLRVSPAVSAALIASLARRVQGTGKPVAWRSAASLEEDPALPWAPGSILFDGEGETPVTRLLAAPHDDARLKETPPPPGRIRLSYRDQPRPAPTNLILKGLARATPEEVRVQPDELHLLEVERAHAGTLLVRATLAGHDGVPVPLLVPFRDRLEDLVEAGALAARPFAAGAGESIGPAVPGYGHAHAPEMIVHPLRR